MKIALVCPTVGQTRRGYERFMTDLFGFIRQDADVTLFKGAGEAGPGECVVPHMKRTGWVARIAGNRLRYTRYRLEFATFAAALCPHLLRGRFDVVHAIDPPLARPLAAMRRLARSRYRLVFTDGGPAPFDASPYADIVHYMTPEQRDAAIARGAPAAKSSVLPVGVDATRVSPPAGKDELRRRYGVDSRVFVILAVTTLNRHHKRVDHLIEEAAQVPGEVLLWIDGSIHPDGDATLLDLARARLGTRLKHTHVPSDRVGELYRMADVIVSAATYETFGVALAEAMCAGLPVIAHDSPHFRWLLEGHGHHVDMTRPGALAAELARLAGRPGMLAGQGAPEEALRRFGWHALKDDYLDLYRQAVKQAA